MNQNFEIIIIIIIYMKDLLKRQVIMFIIMVLVGILFNPMNILAYRLSDLYLALTLFYGGLLMASNMIWAHEIVHYLHMGHFNIYVFLVGVVLSVLVSIYLLREQAYVNDEQWLRRMISHHSTALTTSNKIVKRTKNEKIMNLANEIIETQEREIELMKKLLK